MAERRYGLLDLVDGSKSPGGRVNSDDLEGGIGRGITSLLFGGAAAMTVYSALNDISFSKPVYSLLKMGFVGAVAFSGYDLAFNKGRAVSDFIKAAAPAIGNTLENYFVPLAAGTLDFVGATEWAKDLRNANLNEWTGEGLADAWRGAGRITSKGPDGLSVGINAIANFFTAFGRSPG